MPKTIDIQDLEVSIAPSGCGGSRVELAWLLIYVLWDSPNTQSTPNG